MGERKRNGYDSENETGVAIGDEATTPHTNVTEVNKC